MSSAEDMRLLTASSSASSSEPQPGEPPAEPTELEAPPSSPQPGLRANMVAHEVPVKATGTQAGKSAGQRELFNEETVSVLVFENGGVIRLSAAVAPGQLLFLANMESKREVVAQVKRKRADKPTSCYVELEFAEPAPRFWGMEFSAATALLPKNAKDAEAAALVISAETIADEPAELPPAPTAEDVQALKREVEALRGQAVGVAVAENLQPVEHGPVPIQFTAAEQALLPNPSLDFSTSFRKSMSPFRARGNFTPGFRLRLAVLIAALLVTVAGAARFKHWIPWQSATKKPSATLPSIAGSARPSPPGNREAPKELPEFTNTTVTSGAPVTSPGIRSVAAEPPAQPIASSASAAPPDLRRPSSSTSPEGNHATVRATARASSNPIVPFALGGVTTPPKLIKSVRAVASLDDLHDFETGNVVIDAVVGTEGEIHFISVISGPPSLRAPAVGAVKQYRYEPATRNGQPVPAHVNITIRFRFES